MISIQHEDIGDLQIPDLDPLYNYFKDHCI
ncbi:unnamed protein product, partial [Rotaria sp. Silwood1]